jgi:hypothetical protein
MTVAYTATQSVRGRLNKLNDDEVGLSTGCMAEIRGDWDRLIEEASSDSSSVVELSALSSSELPGLVEYLRKQPSLPFRHVMVHGPAKGMAPDLEAALPAYVSQLPPFVDGIVLHPETLSRPDALVRVGHRLLLENMDPRKNDAKTPNQLERFFSVLPQARFCLDVAHAWLNDPTMSLAHDFLDAFRDRLAEVHISSILPSGTHVALDREQLDVFEPVLRRCIGVPWILEARPRALENSELLRPTGQRRPEEKTE